MFGREIGHRQHGNTGLHHHTNRSHKPLQPMGDEASRTCDRTSQTVAPAWPSPLILGAEKDYTCPLPLCPPPAIGLPQRCKPETWVSG